MIKDSRVLVVSYDHNGKDEAVLLVLERSYDEAEHREVYNMIRRFSGQEASDLYGIFRGMEKQK